MISTETLKFLKALSKNNNREWFYTQKPWFNTLYGQTKKVFEAVQLELSHSDDIEKTKMYRIYRDVRFSKDKTPYKDYFSAALYRAGKHLRGSYYIHLEPGGAFLAVGFWSPNKEDLYRIRKEIELDASDFHAFLNSPNFYKTWGEFQGETLKTAPKGFSKEHPEIELLRRKNFVFVKKLSDGELTHKNFVKNTAKAFKEARPFLDLFSAVLTTDLNGVSLL